MQTDDVIAVIRAAMQRDGGKRTEEDVEIQDQADLAAERMYSRKVSNDAHTGPSATVWVQSVA